jgi:hypothetical protein
MCTHLCHMRVHSRHKVPRPRESRRAPASTHVIGYNNPRDEVARHRKYNFFRCCAAPQQLCGTRRCCKRAQISELEHIVTLQGPQSQRKSSSADAPLCKDIDHRQCNLSSYCATPQPLSSSAIQCSMLASDAGLLPATSRGAADSSHAPRGFWPLSAQLERCTWAQRAPARRVRFGRSRTSEVPACTLRPHLCPGPVQGARHQGAPSRAAECGPRRPRAPEPCGRAPGEVRVGADPGSRGGHTRGTLQRRTGCTRSAPRCKRTRAQLFASCATGEGATNRRHDKATGHRHARDGSRGDSQVCVECLC